MSENVIARLRAQTRKARYPIPASFSEEAKQLAIEEVRAILAECEVASRKGLSKAEFTRVLSTTVIDKLHSMGFQVKVMDDPYTTFDYFVPSTVSWEE